MMYCVTGSINLALGVIIGCCFVLFKVLNYSVASHGVIGGKLTSQCGVTMIYVSGLGYLVLSILLNSIGPFYNHYITLCVWGS